MATEEGAIALQQQVSSLVNVSACSCEEKNQTENEFGGGSHLKIRGRAHLVLPSSLQASQKGRVGHDAVGRGGNRGV